MGRSAYRENGLMPLRNRVTPLGEIVAAPERGLVYGNRGCPHDAAGQIVRRQATRRWIACRLEFRGRYRRPQPQPGRYTGLFFLDDATAMAAGHRPCAECRREDYNRLVSVLGLGGADAIDEQLDHERRDRQTNQRRFHEAPFDDLPDGAFVMLEGDPHLVRGRELLRWSPAGYTARTPRPAGARGGEATVITPPSLVALLRTERTPLVPLLHPTAIL